jgi:LPXTG-motif cell wall-anchored protein
VIAVYLVLLVGASAQVKTTTSTKEGPGVKEVTVERGEVVYVSGNDLIVKMEDGQMRHFPNIPESARVTVDGKELGIDELTPGMKLERTLTVTTIPRTITTVETVTGKVWQVTPPTSVTLTLKNGEHQAFKIPKGQKFNVDGQETDAWGLKKGTNITATRIREVPETVVQHERQVSGQMPPPPPPLPANTPILIAQATPPRAAPAPTAAAPAALPATGSFVPLIGLLGLLLAGSSVFMRFMRRRC